MTWLAAATQLLNTKGGASLAGGIGASLAPPPAGPSNAATAVYGPDNSGWNVNFSGIQSASSAQDKSGGVPGFGSSGVGAGVPWWVWAGLVGVALWRLRTSKS